MSERLRFGGYQGDASVHTRALRHLAESLERLSGGRVAAEIEVDVTRSGRKAAKLLALVEAGEIDLCYFASSYLAGRIPSLGIFDIPFGVTDRDAAYARLDGKLLARLRDAVRSGSGYELLAFWDNGFRHLSNGVRPLRHPEDCAGLSIRTLDNALHHRLFGALGFTPVTIDVKDLVEAVASGRVEAQENPLTNTVNFGIDRLHRHHSLTGHVFGVALVLANRARWDALPDDMRRVVMQGVGEATGAQRRYAAQEDIACLARIRAEGGEVLTSADLDLAAFRAAAEPVRREALAGLDPKIVAAFGSG